MKLTGRLLFFNLLLLFIPLVSMLYLDTYEKQLLETQERAMVQQGRIFSSALAGSEDIRRESEKLLHNLQKRLEARIRVVDREGRLLADSARPATKVETDGNLEEMTEDTSFEESSAPNEFRINILYRIVTYPIMAFKKLFFPPETPLPSGEFYSGTELLMGPEIRAALEGRYGAATRSSTGGQRSLNLYSAIPILDAEETGVIGAVLVSKSTYRILDDLYKLRLDIIKIFLLALGCAVFLSLLLAQRITVPVVRLSGQAERVLDRRGLFGEHFEEVKSRDEIGDLSRSLKTLSERLEKKIGFIDSMAADLVHELKNPVSSIRTSTELVQQADEQDRDSFFQRIQSDLNRMERLLDRLREISRIGAELEGEEKIPLELVGFLKDLIGSYRSNRRIFLLYTREDMFLKINPDRMTQVVTNLLDNALSFSPSDGRVDLELDEKGGRLSLTVSDRG
ncbi:MAG: sensor N-terminal transmembrane domain-containing protein, partial [Spirochaetales bacterium]|nr:sensor N-terminal transmembrane domain-containing protein [Spirochaetales bacterium]